jgi:hypothetical protein
MGVFAGVIPDPLFGTNHKYPLLYSIAIPDALPVPPLSVLEMVIFNNVFSGLFPAEVIRCILPPDEPDEVKI